MKTLFPFSFLLCMTSIANAHEGHSHAPSPETKKKIVQVNTEPAKHHFVVFQNAAAATVPELAKVFEPFKNTVNVRFDKDFLFVESNGMPEHPMMIGITAWQQQVPLPQNYTGDNAYHIPLHPVPAKNPMSTKEHFFRGAIAVAVNGIPIFNPIKNDGKTDTLAAGELDQWGGHCGRADDYHYHIAPVHLEKIVGAGSAVAIALDGYPIYGYNDPNGQPPTDLDWLNGHKGPDGKYHYHATKTFPYLNGGFYGEVVERDGQVDPQPRARPLRPSLSGLRGAKINGFENPKQGSYVLLYDVDGEKRSINYTVADNGSATFQFVSPQGTKTETYTPREGGGAGGGARNGAPSPDEKRPPQGDRPANQPNGPRGGDGGQGGQREGGGGRQGGGGQQQGGGQRQGGGGNPFLQALDANRDGILDKAEIQNAATALLTLDKNKDGQISGEELRGPGGGQADRAEGDRPQENRQQGDRPQGGPRGGDRPDQAGGPNAGGQRGPQPGDGPRQPWILVHADEIDLDKNKIISRDEIVGEATKAFDGYDADKDDTLTAAELNSRGGSRSAMGGFLKGHSKEIDRDGDGILSRSEAVGNAERMFAKMDTNGDGNITTDEMEASRRK